MSKKKYKQKKQCRPDGGKANHPAAHGAASARHISAQEPPVEIVVPAVQTPEDDRDRRVWPDDKPMPTHYVKTASRLIPCIHCRRILLDDGVGQAVVCTQSGTAVAWLRCRHCNKRFTLPVARV